MTAGTNSNNGTGCGYTVKIPTIWHPIYIGKVVLIPASAQYPALSAGFLIPQALNHISKAVCMFMKGCHIQRIAIAEQMHVAVVETCADELTLQIHHPIRIVGEDGFVGTDSEKLTVFFQKCLLQGKAAGIDGCVAVHGFHRRTSCR